MRGTNMSDTGFTVAFINNYDAKAAPEGEKFSPATYAMHWAMTATFMHRLFTREDMHEFLFRLAIVLDSLGIAENWFMDGRLFNYTYKAKCYSMPVKDLFNHFGLEIADALKNGNERKFFMENLSKGIGNALLTTMFGPCQILAPRLDADDQKVFNAKHHTPELSDELINKAKAFAGDMLSQAPEGLFTASNKCRMEKLEEIEKRKRKVASLPTFDLDLLPADVRKECMVIMLHPDSIGYYYAADSDDEERRDEEQRLIYLAWLWANDMMVTDGICAYEVEGVSIDYDAYELEDGGFNLLETYEMYNMKETEPLLKGVGSDLRM